MNRCLVLLAVLGACDGEIATPDAPTSAWRSGPAMPRRALAPGVTKLGQRVVVAGGFDGTAVTARIDAYDVADEAWVPLPDAPVAWTDLNLATVGVTLYIAGGLDGAGAAHGETYLLDPGDNQWKPLAGLDPAVARGGAGVASAPARIYLIGGASSTEALATCFEYDTVADQWTELPPLPAPRVHPAVLWRPDGTLIVAGGFASLDATQPSAEVWALSPPGVPSRVWRPRTPMRSAADPDLRGGCAYGAVLGELVCAGGQVDQAGRAAVDSYDPYLDVWTVREPMPVPRGRTQGAGVGGRLFVPGGTADTEPSDTLYIYAPFDTYAPSDTALR